jgi:hypothetical protein
MIQYSLKCGNGHSFDSWFQSAEAFDTLKSGGHLMCQHCGDGDVQKAIMTPRVATARKKAAAPESVPSQTGTVAAQPDAKMQEMLAEMKQHVEANSTYVGGTFADEARKQHLGDAPERPIYGEAKPEDAKALLEDGVPVLPLPFTPTRKTN